MNDDRTDLEVFQQCRDLVFGDWTSTAIFVPLHIRATASLDRREAAFDVICVRFLANIARSAART
jgi:hypothetical protein